MIHRSVSGALVAALLMATLLVGAVAGEEQEVCRSPPRPAWSTIDSGSRRQDSDGITRTTSGCTNADGRACALCCATSTTSTRCCEDVSASPLFPAGKQLWVPMRFILVTGVGSTRNITQDDITSQLSLLNSAFSPTPFRFFHHSTARFEDARMVASCNTDPCYVNPATCDFYRYTMPRVKVNPEEAVNVVVCDLPYYGEAQWPWATPENDDEQYIQVSYSAFANWGTGFHSMGKTSVHESGHYFGLLHTFEGCTVTGDWVSDTQPATTAARDTEACNYPLDSCVGGGLDDHNNYMNYAADQCMAEFTKGQIERMQRATTVYRPQFMKNYLVDGSCQSGNLSQLSQCSCTNPSLDPKRFCRENGGITTPSTAASSQGTTSQGSTNSSSTATGTVAQVTTNGPGSTSTPPPLSTATSVPSSTDVPSSQSITPAPTGGSVQSFPVEDEDEDGISGGFIALVAIAVLFAIGCTTGVVYFCTKGSAKNKKPQSVPEPTYPAATARQYSPQDTTVDNNASDGRPPSPSMFSQV